MGASSDSGVALTGTQIERPLTALSIRLFMMNNVHEDAPEVFESRWTMSYLRGPLTRNQIQTVMAGRRAEPAAVPAQSAAKPADTAARPVLPAGIAQYFIPVRGPLPYSVIYRPMLLAVAPA